MCSRFLKKYIQEAEIDGEYSVSQLDYELKKKIYIWDHIRGKVVTRRVFLYKTILSSSCACPSVCHNKRLFIASTTMLLCQTSWSEPCSERAHSPQNTACFWLSQHSLCLTTISDKSPCQWCGYITQATSVLETHMYTPGLNKRIAQVH